MIPTLQSQSSASIEYALREPPTHHHLPSLLGDTYELRRPLGHGSMGALFEAQHVRLGRPVAVKVLAHGNGSCREQFEREARVHCHLVHPHIVQVFDYGVDGEVAYLVMELLRGETLRERLSRCGVLPLHDTVEIVRALASALTYAHGFGVVHRDLKPENVFLAKAFEQPFLTKLLDFGVCSSKAVYEEEESGVRGTPQYMSPEQAQGRSADVDHRSDQFSLAIVAYELLTGYHPFSEQRPWATMQRIVSGTFQPASSKCSTLPDRVDDVFARALAKDSARRFASINDFAEAFTSALLSGGSAEGNLPAPRTLRSTPPPSVDSNDSKFQPPSGEIHSAGDTLRDVLQSLTGLRQSLALGNTDAAAEQAERALAARVDADPEVEALLALTRDWIERAFEASLGGPTARFAAALAPRQPAPNGHEALCLHLLSRGARVEQIPELFTLSRLDSLRLLYRLRSRGVIREDYLSHSAA